MIIELGDIGGEGRSFDVDLPADLLDDGVDADPVHLRAGRLAGTLARSGEDHRIDATIEARVERPCVRCLETVAVPLDGSFSLEVLRAEPGRPAGETEMDPELVHVLEVRDGRVDLLQVAREAIFLTLPLRTLCSEACRGLCPTCGANRNLLQCACAEGAVDPRLEPLRALRGVAERREPPRGLTDERPGNDTPPEGPDGGSDER